MFSDIRSMKMSSRKKKPDPLILDKFQGVNQAYSETRIGKEFAKEARNLMLVEDGIWFTRWGTKQYGPDMGANIDGYIEYTKSNGTRELIVGAGGTIYRVDPDASTKTAITGATYTSGKRLYFLQISNQLYIGTGFDALMRYDGSTIVTYTGLSTPTGLAIVRGAGLSAGSLTYYYRVSAVNAVGETLACSEVTVTVNKDRDQWTGATEYVDLNWTDVSGAVRYIVYYDDAAGYGQKLVEVNASEYRDDGTAVPNPYIQPPISDTTTGPKLGPMALAGNRIVGIEDPEGDNPWTFYFSGQGGSLGNFSPAFGGGWVRLEYGGRARCVTVINYQGKAFVLTKTADGKGAVWQVDMTTQTIDSTAFIVPTPLKVIGAIGTDAARSVFEVENDLVFMNRSRVGVFGNEPGVLGVLRANEISRFIRDVIASIYDGRIAQVCGYYFDYKVFFSIPTGDAANNEIWVLDRERTGWYGPWTIGVSQFGEFTDTSNITRLVGAVGTKLVDFSENYLGDSNVAFTQRYTSPRMQVSRDFTKFAKVKKTWVRLRGARGNIRYQVLGTGKKTAFSQLLSTAISPGTGTSGIGNDIIGEFIIGTTSGTPSTFQDEALIKERKMNKLIRDIQFSIESDTLDSVWGLTGLQAEIKPVKTSSPPTWRS